MSKVNGMYASSDGEYSHDDVEVYLRQDTTMTMDDEDGDIRLYRNEGHWIIADFSTWPPTSYYRCDPNAKSIEDARILCSANQKQAPTSGYSPAQESFGKAPYLSYHQECLLHPKVDL